MLSLRVLFSVGCTNSLICFAVSTKFLFWGTKLKCLMTFSLISFHRNVSPQDSSILYHLFGKSDNIDGNRCGHVRSSLYPSLFHSFSHVLMWSSGSCHWMNIGIWAWLVNFFPPDFSMKKVEAVVHVYNIDWWVSHHLTAGLVKVSTKLCSQPCSPMFLDTCSICITGDSLSLYLGICLILIFAGFRVGYSLVFFSNIFGMMDATKHWLNGFFCTFWMVQHRLAYVS